MENVKKAQGNMGCRNQITILAFIGPDELYQYGFRQYPEPTGRTVGHGECGHDDRPVYRMLVYEGLFYAGGSILLTGTVGLLITYLCFSR